MTKYLLFSLILLGFFARATFWQAEIFHVDEFITLLATVQVAETGLPILPSGLFYDHGLLFTYLAAAFVRLTDFSEEIARWPSVLLSTATIAAYYVAARRLFDSPLAGVLAAAISATDQLSIVWGGRARMYSAAHLFSLLTLVWLFVGTLKQPTARTRYLSLLFLLGLLLSHTVSFLMLLPLSLTLALATLFYRRDWLTQPRLWLEIGVAAVAVGGVLWVVSQGQTGSTVSLQDTSSTVPTAPFGLDFLQGFFAPGLAWSRFDDLLGFLLEPDYSWLLFITLSLLPLIGWRLWRRQATFAEIATLILLLFISLTILEQGGLLSRNWQKTRYLYILVMPAFFLMGAFSLSRWLDLLTTTLPLRWRYPVALLLGLTIIGWIQGDSLWRYLDSRGTGNYHTAFESVRTQWHADDQLMTVHPAAAYLYAGQIDYYANQVTAKVLENDTIDDPVDRYIGSPLVDSVADFNTAISTAPRLWFVVDDQRLFSRYETLFTQQIFAQMDYVQRFDTIYIFVSRPHPLPLEAQPRQKLEANFADSITLTGYQLHQKPNNTVALDLYWQPLGMPAGIAKVFVQLRNPAGETVAQADHFMHDGLLTLEIWESLLRRGELLRDRAHLTNPPNLTADHALYIGLYNPATMERVPLRNDVSGENAVIIPLATPKR